jgi:GH35 family endo-1,4-beta-xylanase
VNGNTLVVNSGGTSGTNALLNDNGFVGSYISLPAPGDVTVTVSASGTGFGGVNPHMNFAIGDALVGFDVTPSTFNNYQHTFTNLPAGTHFLRTEFNNDRDTNRSLSIGSLDVSGATLLNANTSTNALNAADNYVANYRKGSAQLALLGATPGSTVDIKLKRHNFNFGVAVPNSNLGSLLVPNPTPGSTAARFQQALIDNRFNSLTAENGGKWDANEGTRDVLTANAVNPNGGPNIPYIDRISDFAMENNMNYRQHNLIWGPNGSGNNNQQPGWAHTMLQNPNVTDAVSGDLNSVALRDEISERIDYYAGDRAHRFYEIDVFNESYHTGSNNSSAATTQWDLYGASGIAEIYKETKDAIAAAGSSAKVFVNEYSVLQNQGADYYADWYMRHMEEIQNAGKDLYGEDENVVEGIGFQYYVTPSSLGNHSSARVYAAMQNMAVQGLPMSLTEWGGTGTNDATSEANAATILTQTARLVFGMPGTTGITLWNLRNTPGVFAPVGTFYENDWSIRDPAVAWQALMAQWDTNLQDLVVQPDGTIDFTGFYGEYEVTIGEETFTLDLTKGLDEYSLVVGPPSADFDLDGDVDGRDFLAWQKGYGTIDPTFGDGDANYDHQVDGADLAVWQAAYGTLPLTASVSVPEPACATLLAMVLVVAVRRNSLVGRNKPCAVPAMNTTRCRNSATARSGLHLMTIVTRG